MIGRDFTVTEVNGGVFTSDIRTKTDVQAFNTTIALEAFDQLDVITFRYSADYKVNTDIQIGLNAQQAKPIYPNLIATQTICKRNNNTDCYEDGLAVKQQVQDGLMIAAIKELSIQNKALMGLVNTLQTRIKQLENLHE